MQIIYKFFLIIVNLLIDRNPMRISTVHLWNRVLNRKEIETLYKAEKLIEESYP